jgi:hypothetical protein
MMVQLVLRVLKGFRVMMVLREFQVLRVHKVHFQLEHNPVR